MIWREILREIWLELKLYLPFQNEEFLGELRRNDEFMAALRHDQDFLRDCERDEPLMTGPCGPQGEPPLPPGIPLPKVC